MRTSIRLVVAVMAFVAAALVAVSANTGAQPFHLAYLSGAAGLGPLARSTTPCPTAPGTFVQLFSTAKPGEVVGVNGVQADGHWSAVVLGTLTWPVGTHQITARCAVNVGGVVQYSSIYDPQTFHVAAGPLRPSVSSTGVKANGKVRISGHCPDAGAHVRFGFHRGDVGYSGEDTDARPDASGRWAATLHVDHFGLPAGETYSLEVSCLVNDWWSPDASENWFESVPIRVLPQRHADSRES